MFTMHLELSQKKSPKEIAESLGSVLSSGQMGRSRHPEPCECMLGYKLGLSIIEYLQSIGVIFQCLSKNTVPGL